MIPREWIEAAVRAFEDEHRVRVANLGEIGVYGCSSADIAETMLTAAMPWIGEAIAQSIEGMSLPILNHPTSSAIITRSQAASVARRWIP